MKNQIATIGIIDDDKIYQLILKRLIEQTNLTKNILQFFDGEEALDYFSIRTEQAPDLPELIFLDINMPYMNGWQFLDEFLSLHFQPPYRPTIYIVSSSTNSQDFEKAREYSILSGYLVKPVTRQNFIDLVHEHT